MVAIAAVTEPTPLNRCLAELALECRAFTAGNVYADSTCSIATREVDGGAVKGLQADGRYLYEFGHEDDAREFRDRVSRIAPVYGLDGDCSIQLYRDGSAEVLVNLIGDEDDVEVMTSLAGSLR